MLLGWCCSFLPRDLLVCGGSSAVQELLIRHPERKIRVLVVWEPILATDWRPPSESTLARMPDSRVRQFWDPTHAVAGKLSEIVKQKPPQPEPGCCVQNGFSWDDAILYAPREHWKDEPTSVFWNGPVVRIIPALENALNEHR
jgi:hypothetical protein